MKRVAWLILLLLTACSAQPPASPSSALVNTPSSAETIKATEVSSTPTQNARPHQDSLYVLNATLDYAAHYLAVTQEITYTNNSNKELSSMPLILESEKQGALLTINSISYNRPAETLFERTLLVVLLEPALQPGEQIKLSLDYSLALPQGFRTLGWSERQTNFVDWYPYIPPYDDEISWLLNEDAAQGEDLAFESADFDVQLTVLNGPALTRIAAPAPAAEISAGTFAYHLENARRFSWSVSGNYETEDTRTSTGLPVTVYFFEEDRDAAEASLRAAAQAIEIYSELFGAFPYESLSIVECNFPDGMESDGLFFLDREYFHKYNYSSTNLLVTLSAHETAHNWWYGSVGNDPARQPWLDEALATYSELLFYERAYSDDVEWWWDERVNRWAPSGWVDSTAYELTDFRSYVNAVYLRGAQFLNELRTTMGDEAFFAFLKEYAQQGAGQIMTSEKFLALLDDSTDKDLVSILNEYFQLAD